MPFKQISYECTRRASVKPEAVVNKSGLSVPRLQLELLRKEPQEHWPHVLATIKLQIIIEVGPHGLDVCV